VRHVKRIPPGVLNDIGIRYTANMTDIQVALAVQVKDAECLIMSTLQLNPLLDAMLERDGSFEEIAKAHVSSYTGKCEKDIQDVIARVLKSKMYTRTAGFIGEENAIDVVKSALRYQMKRHHRHDALDPKLTYNSMLRSIEFDGAGKIAQVTAERCRKAIPNRLAEFYPLARSLNRKITMISGPTNSGKTYRALELLKASKSGAYLGPLRLLALEVCEKLREDGYPTSLITGEFIDEAPGAKFMAATIEMLDFNHRLDTIIIDEAHMLPYRVTPRLQAILGAPAVNVIVLGSPESEAVVASLAEYLGEELQVERVERFTPYSINTKATPFADIKPATAVIAFSRKDVLAIASELNDMGRTTAVVYGALSPAVRREQARKFRDGEAEILVAE